MTHRVVFTDHTFDDLDLERETLGPDVELVDGEATDEPLEALVTEADGLIVMYDEIDEDLIDSMNDCVVISRTGIGVDNVDVSAATDRGIYVTNVPDYCIPEVSDHVMALMLALQRKIVDYANDTRAGEWDVMAGREMHRLEGQTIGLVAFGNIARAVAGKAAAFGMDVLAHDPYLEPADIRDGGAEPVERLDTLLATADVVSVHTPLTPETRGMIDAEAFETMKDGAFVINAARGGIIDEAALAAALEAGQVAGAGIDTLESEPPAPDNPLVTDDRVILTPHAAWNSAESMLELREKAARNVREALEGEVPTYLFNRDVIE